METPLVGPWGHGDPMPSSRPGQTQASLEGDALSLGCDRNSSPNRVRTLHRALSMSTRWPWSLLGGNFSRSINAPLFLVC